MTTLKEVDDALHAFEQAQMFAFVQLAKAYDVLANLNILFANSGDTDRVVEPIEYLQEVDKGGFEVSDGRFGVIVDMHGFSLHDVGHDGELDEQRPREDTLRVLCAYILSKGRMPKSHPLFREAKRLNALLGPIVDTFEEDEDILIPTIAKRSFDSYAGDESFLEFVDREFEHTVVYLTLEEMVEFAFGDADAAIQAYEESRSVTKDDPSTEG